MTQLERFKKAREILAEQDYLPTGTWKEEGPKGMCFCIGGAIAEAKGINASLWFADTWQGVGDEQFLDRLVGPDGFMAFNDRSEGNVSRALFLMDMAIAKLEAQS